MGEKIVIRSLAAQLPGETAILDAQILLAQYSGHNRAWLFSHPEASLTAKQQKGLETAVRKLQNGVPLPYVLGHWEFFGLDFYVTPAVLIPRPETELLVETALAYVRSQPQADFRFLDIGTGSGIIPISLAIHAPGAALIATDISSAALKIASLNAERHGVNDRIQFLKADLLPDNLQSQEFDIISANLPYIPSETLRHLEIFGKEPSLALDGGIDGLDLIRKLLARLADAKLAFNLLLLEIEQRQGAAVSALARETFPTADIRLQRDLAGFDRLVVVTI
jgi:release factor glutamine methyltransferase